MKVHSYVVCIGSNTLEESEFAERVAAAGTLLEDVRKSGIYRTADALGRPEAADYLNCVMAGKTDMDAEEFTGRCKALERREEPRRGCMVPLDIDVVLADGKVLRDTDFRAPHFRKGYDSLQDQ